jgi:hypothetical protein
VTWMPLGQQGNRSPPSCLSYVNRLPDGSPNNKGIVQTGTVSGEAGFCRAKCKYPQDERFTF